MPRRSSVSLAALLVVCLLLLLPAAESEAHSAILEHFLGHAIMVIGSHGAKVLALAPGRDRMPTGVFRHLYWYWRWRAGRQSGEFALVNVGHGYWRYTRLCRAGMGFRALIFRKWPVTLEEQPQRYSSAGNRFPASCVRPLVVRFNTSNTPLIINCTPIQYLSRNPIGGRSLQPPFPTSRAICQNCVSILIGDYRHGS